MGIRINTNVQSLAAQRSLGSITRKRESVMGKLSSGERINRAGDDAAGLAISEKLKANIRGTAQARRNAGDGISMMQTAEGGMTEVGNILIRLRELSVQSASDTIGKTERKFSNMEFQNLVSEIDRIAESTKFNGTDLLNGNIEKFDFQVGIYKGNEDNVITFNARDSSVKREQIGIEGLNVLTKNSSRDNLSTIDMALERVSESRAGLGALQNRLQSTINNLDVSIESFSAANSRIRDTDIAQSSAEFAKSNILSNSASTILAQANQSGQIALKLLG